MSRSTDFAAVVRSGARSRHGALVVHQRRDLRPGGDEPLVGLIVSRAVGGSVVRHRVSRRLRAQLADRLTGLPESSGTVVRALPESAQLPADRLGHDLDRALSRLDRRR